MQSAALFIAAAECAENAASDETYHYMSGVRDAFETVFRACSGVPDDKDAYVAAAEILNNLDQDTRIDVVTRAQAAIYVRKTCPAVVTT